MYLNMVYSFLCRRHGSKPDFIKYRLVTSPIVMLPQFVYGATPKWIKSRWSYLETAEFIPLYLCIFIHRMGIV